MRQSVSLSTSNQSRALMRGNSPGRAGTMPSIQAPLSPQSSSRHLADHDRLALAGEQRVDVLEDLHDRLPPPPFVVPQL
jgi:hypothetical protein